MLVLSACGDDATATDDAANRPDGGALDGGQSDGLDLAPSDEVTLQRLCDESVDLLLDFESDPEILELACRLGAIGGASSEVPGGPTCEELYESCIDDPGVVTEAFETARSQLKCPDELAECTVTRAEVDACLAEREASRGVFELTCDDDLDSIATMWELGPACERLQESCLENMPAPEPGYDYDVCGDPRDMCGGDPTGDWVFESSCFEASDDTFEELLGFCPETLITADTSVSGTLTLDPDASVSFSVQLELVRTIAVEGAMGGCFEDVCDEIRERYDCNNYSGDAGQCTCTDRVQTGVGGIDLFVEGNTFRHQDDTPNVYEFCREGDAMTITADFLDEHLPVRLSLRRADSD